MENIIKGLKDFARDEEGLTVVEYVIGAALLVAGLTAIFTTLGSQLDSKLNDVIQGIST
ncbi:hypothetical protein JCM19231_2267 [Vibrio ishigakensis]|uniref:Flp pilus assembly protein n=1 Tax=Vibrio ishigakensis TaxID=1481914 RepID=A0A0B8NTC9_9VIBR|nr:Flp family type IVb pilin [Vibrio ishigakensis]GAM54378.1 hypothetical protein JCM19231_2267 [Vibrio ishigakensis]